MQAEEKKLKVLKLEIEASKHGDTAASTAKVWRWQPVNTLWPGVRVRERVNLPRQ